MARAVQVAKPTDATGVLYDFVRKCARKIGKEKAFLAEFGERNVFLEKCRIEKEVV